MSNFAYKNALTIPASAPAYAARDTSYGRAAVRSMVFISLNVAYTLNSALNKNLSSIKRGIPIGVGNFFRIFFQL